MDLGGFDEDTAEGKHAHSLFHAPTRAEISEAENKDASTEAASAEVNKSLNAKALKKALDNVATSVEHVITNAHTAVFDSVSGFCNIMDRKIDKRRLLYFKNRLHVAIIETSLNWKDNQLALKCMARKLKGDNFLIASLQGDDTSTPIKLMQSLARQFVTAANLRESQRESCDVAVATPVSSAAVTVSLRTMERNMQVGSSTSMTDIATWYRTRYGNNIATCDAAGDTTRSHATSSCNSHAQPSLLIVVEQREGFAPELIQQVVKFLKVARCKHKLPVALLLGVSCARAGGIHSLLPASIGDGLHINNFRTQDAKTILDLLFKSLIIDGNLQLRLGPATVQWLSMRFLSDDLSIHGFLNALKVVLIDHFEREKLARLTLILHQRNNTNTRQSGRFSTLEQVSASLSRTDIITINNLASVIGHKTLSGDLPVTGSVASGKLGGAGNGTVSASFFSSSAVAAASSVPSMTKDEHAKARSFVLTHMINLDKTIVAWSVLIECIFIAQNVLVKRMGRRAMLVELYAESHLRHKNRSIRVIKMKLKVASIAPLTQLLEGLARTLKHADPRAKLQNKYKYLVQLQGELKVAVDKQMQALRAQAADHQQRDQTTPRALASNAAQQSASIAAQQSTSVTAQQSTSIAAQVSTSVITCAAPGSAGLSQSPTIDGNNNSSNANNIKTTKARTPSPSSSSAPSSASSAHSKRSRASSMSYPSMLPSSSATKRSKPSEFGTGSGAVGAPAVGGVVHGAGAGIFAARTHKTKKTQQSRNQQMKKIQDDALARNEETIAAATSRNEASIERGHGNDDGRSVQLGGHGQTMDAISKEVTDANVAVDQCRNDILMWWRGLVKEHFYYVFGSFPLGECCYYDHTHALQRRFGCQTRAAMETALVNPTRYLNCNCCKVDSAPQTLMDDTTIAFKLLMRFDKLFSLVQWFKQFKRVFDKDQRPNREHLPDEDELTRRFNDASGELQILGYFRAKEKKSTDRMEKLIWNETCFG